MEWCERWIQLDWVQAILIMAGAWLLALGANSFVRRVLLKLVAKTRTDLDDQVIEVCKQPAFMTILLAGFYLASETLSLPEPFPFIVSGVVKSSVVILWSMAVGRVAMLLLGWMEEIEKFRLVQTRTMPIFEMLAKTLVVGGAIYLFLLAWHIDVTAWLASAGVVGIAVGFAAKDTLANFFSGVFILADAPYKLGDFVVLGTGERGCVTDIGIRSTRLLTRDDIEIIVPNAVIANTKIINETGGPHAKERVRCTVEVAYGSDLELVKKVLAQAADSTRYLVKDPAPRIRLRELGKSGMRFQVMGWIDEPVLRGRGLDELNTAVYNHLRAAGISIPYPKQDVFIKELPPRRD